MAIRIEWKPVLQALMLRDYHPDYGEERIMVCVNPQPEFWRERTTLMTEHARLYAAADVANQKVGTASEDQKQAAEIAAGQKATEYMLWLEQTFLPGINGWFARLWSFGEDQYTLEDINEYHQVDEHFVTWLKTRSIEMIEAHASAKKKV